MYSSKQLANGNYEIYQNGQRISTGTASVLGNYGLSPTTPSTPAPMPGSVASINQPQPNFAYGAVNTNPQPNPITSSNGMGPTTLVNTIQQQNQPQAPTTPKYYAELDGGYYRVFDSNKNTVASFTSSNAPELLSGYGLSTTNLGSANNPTQTNPSYTVKSGDTLSKIASQYGVNVSDISGYRSGNPNLIYPGEVLTVGKLATTGTTPQQNTTTGTTGSQGGTSPTTPPAVATSTQARDEAKTAEIARIKAELEQGTNKPAQFKSAEEFSKLRQEKGVVEDENELSAIQNEARMAKEELNQFKQTSSKEISQGGYLGGISEAERNLNFRMSSLALREQAVIDRLNNKNSYINTVLGLGKEDYQTAYTNYTDEYNRNVKAVELYNKELDEQQKDALAGFTTMSNLLSKSGLSQLTPQLSTQMDSLALKAGLPTGVFQEALKGLAAQEKIDSMQIVGNNVYMKTTDAQSNPHLKLLQTVSDGKASSTSNNQTTDNERALMSQFRGEQIVKDYNEILGQKGTIDAYIQNGVGGPADLAIVFSFMKGLDPTSVVRESEYDNAAKSGNIFQGVWAKFNGFFKAKGGILPANVRQEFQNLVNQRLAVKEKQYTNVKSQYEDISKRQGLNPQNVVIDYASGGMVPNNGSSDVKIDDIDAWLNSF